MKRHTSTILILLFSGCIACSQAQANTPAKTKNSFDSAKVRQTIAEAKAKQAGSANKKDPDSLYNAADAQYVDTSKAHFDFGPKAANVKYDKRMIMAAEIAAERAHKHSTMRCWMYVKNALVSAKVISSRPTTGYAKQAGQELQSKYGFTKLPIKDPYAAPLGSVLVYGGRGAGHVEIRTAKGFVSDFTTNHASRRPLLGVYVKPS